MRMELRGTQTGRQGGRQDTCSVCDDVMGVAGAQAAVSRQQQSQLQEEVLLADLLHLCLQDAFVEENGLTVLSSLLATSKAPTVLQSVLRCLGTFTEGCTTSLAQLGIGGQALGDLGSLSALAESGGQRGQAAGNALLLERSRAIAAAIRLASEHASSAEGCVDGVSAAALELLLKISTMPGLRNSLR